MSHSGDSFDQGGAHDLANRAFVTGGPQALGPGSERLVGGDDLFGRSADLQDGGSVGVGVEADPLVGAVPFGPFMGSIGVQSNHVVAGQPTAPKSRSWSAEKSCASITEHRPSTSISSNMHTIIPKGTAGQARFHAQEIGPIRVDAW